MDAWATEFHFIHLSSKYCNITLIDSTQHVLQAGSKLYTNYCHILFNSFSLSLSPNISIMFYLMFHRTGVLRTINFTVPCRALVRIRTFPARLHFRVLMGFRVSFRGLGTDMTGLHFVFREIGQPPAKQLSERARHAGPLEVPHLEAHARDLARIGGYP